MIFVEYMWYICGVKIGNVWRGNMGYMWGQYRVCVVLYGIC